MPQVNDSGIEITAAPNTTAQYDFSSFYDEDNSFLNDRYCYNVPAK